MSALGFNIKKGELWHCVLSGTRREPVDLADSRHLVDPDQPRTALANYFKQTFGEVISRTAPDRLAYRVSLDANSADQVAHPDVPIRHSKPRSPRPQLADQRVRVPILSKKALGFAGNKFEACDEMIASRPDKMG